MRNYVCNFVYYISALCTFKSNIDKFRILVYVIYVWEWLGKSHVADTSAVFLTIALACILSVSLKLWSNAIFFQDVIDGYFNFMQYSMLIIMFGRERNMQVRKRVDVARGVDVDVARGVDDLNTTIIIKTIVEIMLEVPLQSILSTLSIPLFSSHLLDLACQMGLGDSPWAGASQLLYSSDKESPILQKAWVVLKLTNVML